MSAVLVNRPSLVHYKNVKILIHDAPTDSNLHEFIQIYRKNNCSTVIRACEASYSAEPLEKAGITLVELSFTDGEGPPDDIIDKFIAVCKNVFEKNSDKKTGANDPAPACLSIHCVAGLGRAPVLACLALIEIAALNSLDAVDLVRKRRRGAINAKQLKFLEAYKPRRKGKADDGGCVIM